MDGKMSFIVCLLVIFSREEEALLDKLEAYTKYEISVMTEGRRVTSSPFSESITVRTAPGCK